MLNPLTRKLELFAPLSSDDAALLDSVVQRKRAVPARTGIISEGEQPSDVRLVFSGFACRYKLLPNGNRQILAYLVPGDFCDLHVFILKEMDHGIETISPCEIVEIPRARILELIHRPNIARALWWVALVDEATLREWLVNLGQRDAGHRIAHLFCEMHLRLKSIGLAQGDTFSLPITQTELADTMGLSSVHVNRSLQDLRGAGLVQFKSGNLTIPDIKRLWQWCDFKSNYLHLDGGRQEANAPSRT